MYPVVFLLFVSQQTSLHTLATRPRGDRFTLEVGGHPGHLGYSHSPPLYRYTNQPLTQNTGSKLSTNPAGDWW